MGPDDPKALREELHVRIFRYPSAPIVETLGLRSTASGSVGGVNFDVCEVVKPHSVRLSLRSHCLGSLGWRAGGGAWHGPASSGLVKGA